VTYAPIVGRRGPRSSYVRAEIVDDHRVDSRRP
jgi:hypothetical protein